MPKTKLEAPNIDLRCILCPKTPRFSDISHLLTHIASKSHLSHKFRLGVESRHQPAAREKLEDFEFWYNHNNLDEMLVDRLAAKEDKKTKKTRAAVGSIWLLQTLVRLLILPLFSSNESIKRPKMTTTPRLSEPPTPKCFHFRQGLALRVQQQQANGTKVFTVPQRPDQKCQTLLIRTSLMRII
jgi:hypothetical protein